MRLIDADSEMSRLQHNYCESCERCKPYGIFGVACTPCWVMDAVETLEDAPTVDAVPVRHCRWIPKYQPPDPKASWSTEYYCSGCGHETHMTVMPDQRDNYIDDYCGGCGARMDAEDINVLTKDGGADNDA